MTALDRKSQLRRNKQLNKATKKVVTSNKPVMPKDAMEASIQEADRLWSDLKKRIIDDPEFAKKPDSEKVDLYQKSEFKDFYINFPIVCRYMICMGQFSNKAFKRFLLKCKVMEPQKGKGSEAAEDAWVQRQADYVRYLWESYQRQHFSTTDAQNVWQHAYQTLIKEFKDFKDMHTEAEEKLKTDKAYNKSMMVKELLQRISNEDQSLDETTTNDLIKKLEECVNEQRKKKLLTQINKDIETTPPTIVGRGTHKELTQSTMEQTF